MEKNKIKSTAHSRYRCQYHIVFAPKYRRKEIYGLVERQKLHDFLIFLDFEPEEKKSPRKRLTFDGCKIKCYNGFYRRGKISHIFEFLIVGVFELRIL